MAASDPSNWPPPDEAGTGADSIAGELASRIDGAPPAPGDAMDWASVAAAYEREAEALGAHPASAELLYEAGRIYEERLGDAAEALAFHRRAFALDPGHLPNLAATRRLAMDAADDALAAEALEAEIAATPGPAARAELLLLRGRLLATLGRAGEAREALAQATSLAPDGFAAAEETARAAAAAGDREALAEAYVRCARSCGDGRLGAHFLSAAAALYEEALSRADRAGELALEAFALAPGDPLLRSHARRHAERLGRLGELAGILRAEADGRSGPAAAEALEALARVEERRGRTDEAVATLERARVQVPDEPRVLAELTRLREARGEWADAAAALDALAAAHHARRADGHELEIVAARLRQAELAEERLGRVDEALRCCREVVALDPRNRPALAALGRLCARAGDWAGLLAAFEAEAEAASDPRERAQRLFKAAQVLEEMLERAADAIARYRAALDADPDLLPARSALERLLSREGRWEELVALLEEDLAGLASPAEREAHLHRMARIREERLGDAEGAAALYRRVLELAPGSRAALSALAATLERLGRHAEQADVLAREAALASDPRRRTALLQQRAEVLDEHGADPAAAQAAWEDVRSVAPSHLPALRALGRLHACAGRWEELAAMFRAEADAARDPEQAAELVLRIGDLLERRLDRPDDAIAAYREVLTLAPAHLPALLALARLYRARGDDESLAEILRAQAAARTAAAEKAAALVEAGRICEERLGDPARALESYEDALRADPACAAARRILERLYAEAGRTSDLAALRRAAVADEAPADRAERLLRLARLEADRVADRVAALSATLALDAAAPAHPAALLLEVRLSPEPDRRARALAALAAAADAPAPAAALLAAAALETRPAAARRATLARASALAPASAALAVEEARRLRVAGDDPALAAFCAERGAEAADRASRVAWALRAGEAFERVGDPERALAAFQAALEEAPAHLPALRAARALLARRGDWGGVRATLQAEAAARQDPHEAAQAWVEAGAVAEHRFADAEGAAQDYRRAAERDPADPTALARLDALLEVGGRLEELAGLKESRARAERDPARAALAWLAAARAVLRVDGGRDRALTALDRALDARADLALALELRARLRAEAGRAADAAADLEACLALGGEAASRIPLHLAAAALCQDVLVEPARGLAHLEAVLALAPEHAEALERFARLLRAEGRLREAAAALRRLADLPGLAREAALAHLVALAETEAELSDLDAAIADARRALDLDAGHAAALELLVRLEQRRGDPDGIAAALEAAASESRDPRVRADAHVEAARRSAGAARGRPGAIEHLRAALEVAPEREDVRLLLAETCEDASPTVAVDQHRWLLARDPLRVGSWTALFRLFERGRQHDRAYVAATVLRWLGAGAPGTAAERLLLEGDRQALPPPPPLPAGDFELLRDPRDRGPLADLVAAAGDALAAALAGAPAEHGAPVREDHPFRRILADLARSLGAGEYEVYAAPLGKLSVEPGQPPAVLAGADLIRRTTAREQRFLLGRAAARIRARSAVADAVPASALGDGLAALVRQVVPGYAGTGRPGDELVRAVAKALSRRARKAMEEPARSVAALRPPPDVAGWREAAAATADRAGLVLCGDVPTALGWLLREGGAGEGGDLAARVRDRPEAMALLAFAASEDHFVLRQRLRVAIA